MSEYENGERLRRESPSSVRLVTVEQKIERLIERGDERHKDNKEILDKILAQTTATNGRVNALEAWRDKLSGMWMALVVVGAAAAAGAGAVGWFAKLIIDHYSK